MSITGTGTSVDPYMIHDVTDLQSVGTYDPRAYYKLANDIDASATSSWNSGSGFMALGGGDSLSYRDYHRLPASDATLVGSWTVTPVSPTTLWDKVDERYNVNPDDSDYINSGTVDSDAWFTLTAGSLGAFCSGGTVVVGAEVNSPSATHIHLGLRVGGNDYWSSEISLAAGTTGYYQKTNSWTTNPDTSAAWTSNQLNGSGSNALEAIGIRATIANIKFTAVSERWRLDTIYSGTFDGGSYTISSLCINQPASDYQALFAYTKSGFVAKDLTIASPDVKGNQYVSSLIAYSDGGIKCISITIDSPSIAFNEQCCGAVMGYQAVAGSYTGCSVTGGSIYEGTAAGLKYYIGGLVGQVVSGYFGTCSSTTNITADSAADSVGGLVGDITTTGSFMYCSYSGTINTPGADDIGGLIGDCNNIRGSYCYTSGSINGSVSSDYVGGLIGYLGNGTISKSYSLVNIGGSSTALADVDAGGLIGCNYGTVDNCYSKGTVNYVSNSRLVGGFIGYNGGSIDKCYSIGSVCSGTLGTAGSVGAFMGYNDGGAVTRCYYDLQTSGQSDMYATSKTTTQMKTQSTFTDWDFSTVWGI